MTDWCTSRQIWLGHMIPIWYCKNKDCNNIMCEEEDPKSCNKCQGELKQDTDVLDTWFSSALWAFSVFSNKEDFDYYFPTSVLITGSDILFFWVTRMIIASYEIVDKKPFDKVYSLRHGQFYPCLQRLPSLLII